ncbi:MAG: nucleotide exchange factor GrpE [Myxococcota bacterium]
MSKPTHVPPHPGQQKRRQPIQDDIMAGADVHDGGEATSAPSEAGPEPELEDIVEEVTETEESAAPSEPVSQDFRDQRIQMLEAALEEREKTLQDYIRAHKRAQVEFESFKTRMRANEKGHADIARGKVVERMLDVYDNLQRSLEASRLADTVDDLRAGVELVTRDFLQRLEELGLTRFDPIGQPFDPNCMEAMGVVPVAEDARNGTVVMTLKPGFRLNDRELRPAMVQVGRKF